MPPAGKTRLYTTAEVARVIGLSSMTLFRWMYNGKIKRPRQFLISASGRTWLWTSADLRVLRHYYAKHLRERGRKTT